LKATKALARWQTFALFILLALLLAGCGPSRHGVSWPSLDLVTVEGQPLVLVTYNTHIDLIDPYLGGARFNFTTGQNTQSTPWSINGANYGNLQFYTSPLVSSEDGNDTLIFPSYSNENNKLIEFNIDTATPVNTAGFPLTGEVVADITLGDGLVYVGYRREDLVALDAETFTEVWRLDTTAGIWTAPLLHEGILYVPSIDHNLYAVDAATGAVQWQLNLEGGISATPLLYNDFLYVGSFSHKLFKISLDGEIALSFTGNSWLWSTPVISESVGASPITDEETPRAEATVDAEATEDVSAEATPAETSDTGTAILYYSDLNGYVYALNADTLSLIWQSRPATGGIRPAPLLVNGFLIVASRDGNVYWLDPNTGATVQKAPFKDNVEILSDILYLPADEANHRPALLIVASADTGKLVTAFNLETFTQQWVYNR
jgi:outer membrane protein assembly factor BamB